MIEIFILSVVQGITEFLPISSSSHLIIISELSSFKNQGLSFDVSLHIGSFLAVVIYFRKDVLNFVKNKDLFLKIVVSSMPVMLIGYILIKIDIIKHLRNIEIIGWTTIFFGVLLYISDKFNTNKKISKDFTLKNALIIGFFQVLSLVPGVSRSGITITAARILNFERYESAKIAFLLSIPTLAAVSVFGLNNIIMNGDFNFSILNIICILFSFISSYLTIKLFLTFIRKFTLKVFVIYRIILGFVLLSVAYL